MKQIIISLILGAALALTACAPGTYYKNHPTTRQQLIDKMGEPHRTYTTDEGQEHLVYKFRGFGTTYMYYAVENGMVVRTGMNPR